MIAALNIAGLVLDLLGVGMMAWDLLTRRAAASGEATTPTLVYEIASAVEAALVKGDHDAMAAAKDSAYVLAMEDRASQSLTSRGAARLRRMGRIGLGLILLGFASQLVSALLALGAQSG